jgi:hypothetical protein
MTICVDHLLRQPIFVIADNFVGAALIEHGESRCAPGDVAKVFEQLFLLTGGTYALVTFPQSFENRLG